MKAKDQTASLPTSTNSPESEFMTVPELMALLHIKNKASFYQRYQELRIPYFRPHRRKILFPRIAVRDWISARTVGGKTAA